MTAPSRRQHRPARTAHPLVAAFVRFVVCGGGVGLASSGALVLLSRSMPMVVANALVTAVSTVIATELHGRISFRSERRGWGVHLRSGLTVAVSYAFTTGALLVLHAVHASPSAAAEQGVYLSASALAGVGRFTLLRSKVFAEPRHPARPAVPAATVVAATATVVTAPAAATVVVRGISLGRDAVVMAV